MKNKTTITKEEFIDLWTESSDMCWYSKEQLDIIMTFFKLIFF